MRPRRSSALAAVLLVATLASRAHAVWPVTGLPLCNVPDDLQPPVALSGGMCFFTCIGTMSLFWQDARQGYSTIYSAGVSDVTPPDPPATVPASLFLQRSGLPNVGGAVHVNRIQCLSQFCGPAMIFVWQDQPASGGSFIRALRQEPGFDWGPDGMLVAEPHPGMAQVSPSVVHDGAGGAIFAWLEPTSDHRWVFAQRIDAHGVRMWSDSGLFVGTDTTTQDVPRLASDGAGGAYLLRSDRRGGVPTLALFHLGPSGASVAGWPASGLVLTTASQAFPFAMLRASSSGAWVAWSRLVTLADASAVPQPFTTLVLPDGGFAPGFGPGGVPVTSGLGGDVFLDDASIGDAGDLLVAFEYTQRLPSPSPTGTDLRVARMLADASHPAGWPGAGLVACDAPGPQQQARLFAQGGGGLFMAWRDGRTGDDDIYALRLLGDGTRASEWPVQGLLVCGVPGTQRDPVIGPNLVGGGFVAWRDGRDFATNQWDLYAQTVSGDARLDAGPQIPARLSLSPAHPNPARDVATVSLALPRSGEVELTVLDVAGRRVHREPFTLPAGVRDLSWDLRTDAGRDVPPGLYLVCVRAGDEARVSRVMVAR